MCKDDLFGSIVVVVLWTVYLSAGLETRFNLVL